MDQVWNGLLVEIHVLLHHRPVHRFGQGAGELLDRGELAAGVYEQRAGHGLDNVLRTA